MSSSAWPDELDLAFREEGAEPRARLFELHVELFVNAPSRDHETIRSFEALAFGFMPRLDLRRLADLARQLAPCKDVPPAVLEYLVQRCPETRVAVLGLAPALPASVADLIIGSGQGEEERLAARLKLDPRTQEKLLLLHSTSVDEALAANPSVSLRGVIGRQLVARADGQPRLAQALLARPDLSLADEAALYLSADTTRRAVMRTRVGTLSVAERSLPPTVSRAAADALAARSEEGDVLGLEAALNLHLGLPGDTSWRCLRPERQELLALALVALGVEEAACIRIFLTLHPALSHSVRAVLALAGTVRSVPRATAITLVEAILRRSRDAAGVEPPARHLPALAPTGKPPHRASSARSDAEEPGQGRRRAG